MKCKQKCEEKKLTNKNLLKCLRFMFTHTHMYICTISSYFIQLHSYKSPDITCTNTYAYVCAYKKRTWNYEYLQRSLI